MTINLEYDFVLPVGYIDETGTVHKQGTMRLAKAKDEISPLLDPRVRANEAYLMVILLSQVVTRLGTVSQITPNVFEDMFAVDVAYLQELYHRINDLAGNTISIVCPYCGQEFEEEMPLFGEP